LIHGSLSPQTVEAVGYSVQLNTASIRRLGKKPRVEWNKPQYVAPENKEANLTTAADVWCLGATVFEVLSQHPFGTPGVELEKGLPLGGVILRCLDKNPTTRCTLKEAPLVEQSQATTSATQPETPSAAAPQVIDAKTIPFRPQDYGAPPNATPASARTASTSRIPHPLTPKAPPRQVTKDDMALVPVGKRHKGVQRQPVGARIRTLDAPEHEPIILGPASDPSAPGVSARVLALGNRPTLVRNVIAVIGLAALAAVALWLIIIPKLQSTEQPLTSTVSAQTATDARPDIPNLTTAPTPTPAIPNNPVAVAPAPAVQPETAPPGPAKKNERLRVVLASFDTRAKALRAMETVSQEHPELLLRIGPVASDSGEAKFALAVGGVLARDEADPLLGRLLKKGLKTAHIVRADK
jgi:hypothetical protein